MTEEVSNTFTKNWGGTCIGLIDESSESLQVINVSYANKAAVSSWTAAL